MSGALASISTYGELPASAIHKLRMLTLASLAANNKVWYGMVCCILSVYLQKSNYYCVDHKLRLCMTDIRTSLSPITTLPPPRAWLHYERSRFARVVLYRIVQRDVCICRVSYSQHLQDLVIESIYADLVGGKLDHLNRVVRGVSYVICYCPTTQSLILYFHQYWIWANYLII